MSRRRGALALVPLTALLLAGCAADPGQELRQDVAALVDDANQRDADAVRAGAQELLATLEQQRASGKLDAAEADRLAALVRSIGTRADLIDADLLERRRAEAEAEQARRELEQVQQQLEEERRRAEEAARGAEEERRKAEEEARQAEDDTGKDDEKDAEKDAEKDEGGD